VFSAAPPRIITSWFILNVSGFYKRVTISHNSRIKYLFKINLPVSLFPLFPISRFLCGPLPPKREKKFGKKSQECISFERKRYSNKGLFLELIYKTPQLQQLSTLEGVEKIRKGKTPFPYRQRRGIKYIVS